MNDRNKFRYAENDYKIEISGKVFSVQVSSYFPNKDITASIEALHSLLDNEEIIRKKDARIKELEEEAKIRNGLLREAVKYLYIGKKQFAPNTTNSEVDYFLDKAVIKEILEGK